LERNASVILSERLALVSLSIEFMGASLDGEQALAEHLLGVQIPWNWLSERALIRRRLAQLEEDPTLQPWLLRAIVLTKQRQMVGHIGFHTSPGPEYLRDIAPTGIEYGYTIYGPFRRQGYAREASEALMRWAFLEHGVREFVVTIAPENVASQRLSEGFGFVQVGSHIDEEDGLEYIYKLYYNGTIRYER